MYSWDKDKSAILRSLSATRPLLRIVLKTKDDPFLLESWIEHHAGIVGRDSLCIADNGSTHPGVADVYKKYGNDLTVFSYSGFHNYVHSRQHFPELYEAIAENSPFYIVMDTDELLVRIDNGRVSRDGSWLGQLEHLGTGDAIPASWLYNIAGSKRVFDIGRSTAGFADLLRYGKPILPSRPTDDSLEGPVIHNCQVPRHLYTDKPVPGLFVLHLANYSSDQRINANKNKLSARGVDIAGLENEEIANLDTSLYADHTVGRLVAEIRQLTTNRIEPDSSETPSLSPGQLELTPSGEINFGDDQSADVMRKVIDGWRELVGTYLGSRTETLGAPSFNDPQEAAAHVLELRAKGESERLIKAALSAMKRFSHHLDAFGHPLFRKEALRAYLSIGDFEHADGLAPIPGSVGGSDWHRTLFAREHEKRGNVAAARAYWTSVANLEPDNGEARAALFRLGATTH